MGARCVVEGWERGHGLGAGGGKTALKVPTGSDDSRRIAFNLRLRGTWTPAGGGWRGTRREIENNGIIRGPRLHGVGRCGGRVISGRQRRRCESLGGITGEASPVSFGDHLNEKDVLCPALCAGLVHTTSPATPKQAFGRRQVPAPSSAIPAEW